MLCKYTYCYQGRWNDRFFDNGGDRCSLNSLQENKNISFHQAFFVHDFFVSGCGNSVVTREGVVSV